MVIKKLIQHIIFSLMIILLLSSKVFAFPILTGQVVDEAHILSPQTQRQLTTLLKSEKKHQVVVVTLSSLDGKEIDEYGYQLGRHWRIGEKGNNNGVLLIIAPNERQARIEVGYGLESVLTDAISSKILGNMTSFLEQNDFNKAAIIGTRQILNVIHSESFTQPPQKENPSSLAIILTCLVLALFIYVAVAPQKNRARRLRLILTLLSFIPSKSFQTFKGKGGSFGGGGTKRKF